MIDYLLLFVTVAIIYFVLIRNKPARKTDWETLPTFNEYKKKAKAKNDEGKVCCAYCGHTEMIERLLKSEKENPDNTKHYHACTNCKVILWRVELDKDKQTNSKD